MPLYSYRAVTPAGDVSSGELEAANESEIVDRLRDQGLLPMQIAQSIGAAAAGPRAARPARASLLTPRRVTRDNVLGLTRELAASWGRRGIRVNAIAPGFFHSRLADAVIEIYERQVQEDNPIPRIGSEGELKGTAVFLASDASSYITGQTIAVDGGMTV